MEVAERPALTVGYEVRRCILEATQYTHYPPNQAYRYPVLQRATVIRALHLLKKMNRYLPTFRTEATAKSSP